MDYIIQISKNESLLYRRTFFHFLFLIIGCPLLLGSRDPCAAFHPAVGGEAFCGAPDLPMGRSLRALFAGHAVTEKVTTPVRASFQWFAGNASVVHRYLSDRVFVAVGIDVIISFAISRLQRHYRTDQTKYCFL